MKIKPLASAAEPYRTGLPSPQDEAEISHLYLMYRVQFVAFVVKYFNCDEATAADVYQDSFLAMYQNLMEGRIGERSASLKTYLFQIGKFKLLNLFRQQRGRTMMGLCGEADSAAPQSEAWLRLQDIAREEVMAMQEPCSSVLSLYYWERKAMSEIARRLNYKNERIAINRKSLCLKKLKELLTLRFKKEGLDYYDDK